MICAIVKRYAHIYELITGHNPPGHSFANSFFDRRDKFLGDGTTNNFIDKFITFTLFFRLNLKVDMTVLAAAAGLSDEFALGFRALCNSFPVRDLGVTDISLDVKFALHTVNDNLQMKFTHTGYKCLVGLCIG